MGHYFTKSNHHFPIFDPIGANSNSKKKKKKTLIHMPTKDRGVQPSIF